MKIENNFPIMILNIPGINKKLDSYKTVKFIEDMLSVRFTIARDSITKMAGIDYLIYVYMRQTNKKPAKRLLLDFTAWNIPPILYTPDWEIADITTRMIATRIREGYITNQVFKEYGILIPKFNSLTELKMKLELMGHKTSK